MTITSKSITCTLKTLRHYIKSGFAGTCGGSDITGGFSIICDPKATKTKPTLESPIDAILTVVQWDDAIPLSNNLQFSIKSIAEPEKITAAEALAALQETLKDVE